MIRVDTVHRVRLLERLMGDDPTEKECVTMWNDRPKLERLLALQEGSDWPGPEHNRLQIFDYELWRAKVRTELGSLAAVLDGLAICREHNLLLPSWLQDVAPTYLASLALPESAPGYKDVRTRFKEERRKLLRQKRAEVLYKVYMQEKWPAERAQAQREELGATEAFEAVGKWFDRLQKPPEIEAAIRRGLVSRGFKITGIVQASEIAHIALKGTWAQAAAETIRQDYQDARVQMRTAVDRKHLSPREEQFVFWDVAFVRQETLKKLGMYIAS